MKDCSPIENFWQPVLGISPVNDLPLKQPLVAKIMAGPPDMGFDMLLMGHGTHRIGMEQHVYAPTILLTTIIFLPAHLRKQVLHRPVGNQQI